MGRSSNLMINKRKIIIKELLSILTNNFIARTYAPPPIHPLILERRIAVAH
jgi:hypothetical protein